MYKPAQSEALDCQATAALLRSMQPPIWASQVAALAATQYPYAWVSLAVWAVTLYYAMRVHLDAALFEVLARDPHHAPAALDLWLQRAGLRRNPQPRSIEDRCRGGRRLAVHFAVAFGVQLVTLAFLVVRGKS